MVLSFVVCREGQILAVVYLKMMKAVYSRQTTSILIVDFKYQFFLFILALLSCNNSSILNSTFI